MALFIPAGQEDERRPEKSGKGGQDGHEDDVVLLQPQGQNREEVNVV